MLLRLFVFNYRLNGPYIGTVVFFVSKTCWYKLIRIIRYEILRIDYWSKNWLTLGKVGDAGTGLSEFLTIILVELYSCLLLLFTYPLLSSNFLYNI